MFFGTSLAILYYLVATGVVQNHRLKRDLEDLYYQQLISTLIVDDKLKTIKKNTEE